MKKLFCIILSIIILITFPVSVYAKDLTVDTKSSTKKSSVDARAYEILENMTLEEKVAQMFMVYMPSKNATEIQKKYQFGGYLLFADNFKNNSYSKSKSKLKLIKKRLK